MFDIMLCCRSRRERKKKKTGAQTKNLFFGAERYLGEQWKSNGFKAKGMQIPSGKDFLRVWRRLGVCHEKGMGREKSKIWQVGCRAVSKRDTSFSAWLGDNDGAQIRMNEKVLRNLSATLQRPMLCQGCRTHIPIFPQKIQSIPLTRL